MNMPVLLAVLLVALLLVGCAQPLPADKSAYAGHWHAHNMSLVIDQSGRVRYRRQQDRSSTSVEGPLKRFVGDDFEVGIGPMSTTFVVSRPPRQVDGRWLMVVDGVELRRADE